MTTKTMTTKTHNEPATTVAAAMAMADSLAPVSDSPRLDAALLLEVATGLTRTQILAAPERVLSAAQVAAYRRLLARRRQGEPMAYLRGRQEFLDFELTVSPAVLIPRPETEILATRALAALRGRKGKALRIADLGTGSGALAIALARASSRWQVLATDISADALAVTRANLARHGLGNVTLSQASWCEGLPPCDLIVSNPPYVADDDPALAGLAFEPDLALRAGADGLAALGAIIAQARDCLRPGGRLLLEHGHRQAADVRDLLLRRGYGDIRHHEDLAGWQRVVAAAVASA